MESENNTDEIEKVPDFKLKSRILSSESPSLFEVKAEASSHEIPEILQSQNQHISMKEDDSEAGYVHLSTDIHYEGLFDEE